MSSSWKWDDDGSGHKMDMGTAAKWNQYDNGSNMKMGARWKREQDRFGRSIELGAPLKWRKDGDSSHTEIRSTAVCSHFHLADISIVLSFSSGFYVLLAPISILLRFSPCRNLHLARISREVETFYNFNNSVIIQISLLPKQGM